MYLSRARDYWVYRHARFYLIYLCLRPGCGWERVCWAVLCVVVSSFMWVLYLVRGIGVPVGVSRATSPSHDVTCSFSKRWSSQSAPLDLIHSNICGPMSARNRTNTPYFITFIDDYSRYNHIYLISHKSEALKCFETYLIEVEKKLERKEKTLHTDRGREYLSDQFKKLCEKKGILV